MRQAVPQVGCALGYDNRRLPTVCSGRDSFFGLVDALT